MEQYVVFTSSVLLRLEFSSLIAILRRDYELDRAIMKYTVPRHVRHDAELHLG